MHTRSNFVRSKSSRDLSKRDRSEFTEKRLSRSQSSRALMSTGRRRIPQVRRVPVQNRRHRGKRRNQNKKDRRQSVGITSDPEGIIAMATLFMGHSLTQAHRVGSTLVSNAVPITTKVPSSSSSLPDSIQVIAPPPTALHKIVPLVFTSRGNRSHHSSCLSRGVLPLPARLVVRTRYQRSFNMSNPGIVFANKRLNPCFCYDVDPNFGTTAMPFFSEVMTLYRFYRCLKASITVQFVNNEAFPVTVWVCPVNFDPTENSASYQNYLSNPNCHVSELGAVGSPNLRSVHKTASTDSFAGARWVGDIDAYSATGSSAPANSWYFAFGVSTSGIGQVSGVTGSVVLSVTFVAFEEASPST